MRALAVVALAAASVAVFLPKSSVAAELDAPRVACARGQIWDGYRCQWANPPAQVQPNYRYSQAPVYEDDDDDYVAEAPPVYAAPSYYAYATPYYYRPPVVSYYGGPRYVYRYGGGHRHHRWRH